jgi:hypothetical protein
MDQELTFGQTLSVYGLRCFKLFWLFNRRVRSFLAEQTLLITWLSVEIVERSWNFPKVSKLTVVIDERNYLNYVYWLICFFEMRMNLSLI